MNKVKILLAGIKMEINIGQSTDVFAIVKSRQEAKKKKKSQHEGKRSKKKMISIIVHWRRVLSNKSQKKRIILTYIEKRSFFSPYFPLFFFSLLKTFGKIRS